MGDYEKDMIVRCKRAIRGGYPIALGKHDTGLFILGLREIKRRNRWQRSLTYTYIQAEIKELRARRSYTEGVVLRLHDEDIRLLIKAIKLGARRKKATGADCLELTWGGKNAKCPK